MAYQIEDVILLLCSLKCPSCGDELITRDEKKMRVYAFKQCLRRCEKCGVGFSNDSSNPVLLYKNYLDNIPKPLREGLNFTLNNSLNKRSRISKKNKFTSSNSEDALTWTFFKYFMINNRLSDLLKLLKIESNDSNYEVYLWGVNINSSKINTKFYNQFIKISDIFSENESSRTEPDVSLNLRDRLIFIEVKYKSPNELPKKIKAFTKYYVQNVDFSKIVKCNHYELYRNWAFASKLSQGKNFVLMNLGLKKLFTDKNQCKLKEFEDSLNDKKGSFIKLSWEEVVDKMNKNDYDDWFIDYLRNKIYSN